MTYYDRFERYDPEIRPDPTLSHMLMVPKARHWTKAEHFHEVSLHVLNKRRPRLRGVSRILDRKPGLRPFIHNNGIVRLLGGK